jgi:acetyltransferase-like isoleucine patch superfamily enzyme
MTQVGALCKAMPACIACARRLSGYPRNSLRVMPTKKDDFIMPLNIIGDATANHLDIDPSWAKARINIKFEGQGSRVVIGPQSHISASTVLDLTLVDGSSVRIAGGGYLGGKTVIFARYGSEIDIGHGVRSNNSLTILAHERSLVTMGEGCLIASNVNIYTSDMHSIIDVATGARINPAANVAIGARVWLGREAWVMKGVSIGAGSIVAGRAVVTRDVGENTLSAGVPARDIRTGVTWDYRLLDPAQPMLDAQLQ